MASPVRLGESPRPWLDGVMELRHLRTIAAVARHGSFTKAAEELYLAQSAISQQIRRLEAELGVEVFHRTSRRVELTAEGRVILGYAQRVLAAVEADELDCAFSALNPDTLGNEFAATLLWEDEIVVALPPGHRLCARKQVTFEELAAEDLIAYRENSALRRRLERTMAERGFEPRNAFICTEMAAVRGLTSKGLGVAVIPRSVAEQPEPPIELRPIGPERLTWPVALVWRAARRQSPAGKAFLKVALDYAENTEPPVLRAA